MAVRTVRCGRCRFEFIIGGVGEATCPQCGARNRIRRPGDAPAGNPAPQAGVEQSPGPGASPWESAANAPGQPAAGSAPEGAESPAGAATSTAAEPRWLTCPNCSYRFAVGEVATVRCPLCSTEMAV